MGLFHPHTSTIHNKARGLLRKRANVDLSAGTVGTFGLKRGNFASLNGWVGKRARDRVSGTDSSQQYPVLEIFPEVGINSDIRFRGKYRLGDRDQNRQHGWDRRRSGSMDSLR